MQMNEFRDAVVRDQALQARLRLAHTTEDVIAIARAAGYALDSDDVDSVTQSQDASLSEPELETVSGALPCWCDPSVVDSKSCR
jgi:predicted ribosomally synthesized peptide with nif11-like leader